MGHKIKHLGALVELIKEDYSDSNVYLIGTECEMPESKLKQRPDVLVLAKHSFDVVLCVAELGHATKKRIQAFIDEPIPDVRWYDFDLNLRKESYWDSGECAKRRALAVQAYEKKAKKVYNVAQRVWTYSERLRLYQQLLHLFGPSKFWINRKPADRLAYKRFLKHYALILNGQHRRSKAEYLRTGNDKDRPITSKAVEQQVDWCFCMEHIRIKCTHMVSYIGNLMAAYEAGFIDRKGLPYMLYQRDKGEDRSHFIEKIFSQKDGDA